MDKGYQQRLAALNSANAVRMGRAQLKKDLKSGDLSIHELMTELPGTTADVSIDDLIIWCPGITKRSDHRRVLLHEAGLNDGTLPARRVSLRQRDIIGSGLARFQKIELRRPDRRVAALQALAA